MATITKEQREAWLAERKTGLGGSDVAKIMGLSKWGSEVDVYLDKIGQLPERPVSLAMELGSELEPFVANKFAEATGKRLIEYIPTIHGTGENSMILGNLDRIVAEDNQDIGEMVMRLQTGDLSCVESILECKTAVRMDDWHDEETGELIVPEYYRAQVFQYLGLVPSAKRIYVAVLFTGLDKHFEWICIERNQEVIDKMFAFEREWWQEHIVRGIMPIAKTEADIRLQFPKSRPLSAIETTDEVNEALEKYCSADKTFKEAKRAKEEAEVVIKRHLGDNEALLAADGKTVLATYKSSKDTISDVIDWEKVAKGLSEKFDNGSSELKELIKTNTQFNVVTRKGSRPLKIKAAKKSAA